MVATTPLDIVFVPITSWLWEFSVNVELPTTTTFETGRSVVEPPFITPIMEAITAPGLAPGISVLEDDAPALEFATPTMLLPPALPDPNIVEETEAEVAGA